MVYKDRLVGVVTLSLFILQVVNVSGKCPGNKYGPHCRYGCHCGVGVICNKQTGCNGNCGGEWLGASCQAQNVALGKTASHSPGSFCVNRRCYNASLAVDGVRGHSVTGTPCTQAGRGDTLTIKAEWSVTLNQSYDIYRFIIDNRNDGGCCAGRINRFVLSVGQSSVPDYNYRECYRDTTQGGPNSAGPGAVIRGQCNSPLRGDIIQIKQTNNYPLTLCEVLVYVCSTGWYGEGCNRECDTKTHCVRCDASQVYCLECVAGKWGEVCSHLCYCMKGVSCDKITGRCPNGSCAAGYKGASCQTPCEPGEYGSNCIDTCGFCDGGRTLCNITSGDCPDKTPKCQLGYQGSRCDKECTAGWYGTDCEKRCGQCSGGKDKCERLQGLCPGIQPRCGAGFQGSRCQTECPRGYYGMDCVEKCGHCLEGEDECDHIRGQCPDTTPKCAPGWQGNTCHSACPRGRHGGDCVENCGYCLLGTDQCDIVSGLCPDQTTQPRCSEGYLGDQCTTECADGFFGKGCLRKCGNCLEGNNNCSHIDGRCKRCAAGWQGNMCDEVCARGTWGESCKLTCSVNCEDGPTSCDIKTGHCLGGCKEGYNEPYCEPSQTDYTAAIAGGIVGGLVGIGLLVTIAMILQCRMKNMTDQRSTTEISTVRKGCIASTNSGYVMSNTLGDVTEDRAEHTNENDYDYIADRSL